MASNIISTKQTIAEINEILSKNITLLNQGAESFTKYSQSHKLPSEYVNSLRNIDENQKKIVKSQKELEAQERKMQQARLAELRLAKQREQAFDKYERQLQREQKQLEKNSGLYNRVQQAINKVTKTYNDLALKKQLNGKLTDKEEKQLTALQAKLLKYNNALKAVDAQIGKNQRNVGNYGSALKGLTGTLRTLASAFGLTSGVFLFAQGIKDAFDRVRQFDKAMANLSGILGKSRDELKGLEEEIIAVAGASIRTSNEVADLATVLIALGKTESEVVQLLKPTNDLSIALQATSEDAGELLISTLNAFGETSAEAQRYADVIAKMRTSTALNFERIKDSLAFLSPTARAVGLSFERTGALLGVLVDNGIKAQRAGRLMSSSFAGLAKEGLTLEQALEKINNSTDKVVTAQDLFGTEAFTLGLILADNIDKMDAYTKTFENAGGALEELTNKQLTSLDARLKILDSTWESFVLNLDNGQNILGNTLKFAIDATAGAIQNLGIAINFVSNGFKNTSEETADLILNYAKVIPFQADWFKEIVKTAELTKEYNKLLKEQRSRIDEQTKAFIEQYGSLAPLVKGYEDLNNQTRDWFSLLKEGQTDTTNETVAELRARISELNKEIENTNKQDIEGIRLKQEKKKALEDELNAILGVNKATKDAVKASRDRIEAIGDELKGTEFLKITIEEQIKTFEKLASKYANGTKEAQMFTERVRELKIALGEVSALDVSGADAEITAFIQPFLNDDASQDGSETFQNNWRDTFQTVADLAGQTMGLISQISNAQFQQQFADLEARRQQALAFAGESAEAQLAVEQQFNERRKEIQRKQAQAQKQQAIFDILINTASAVVRALPNIPLSVAVGALGAAQLAFVASQQIPQFWEGGVVGSEQKIMVNDDPYGKKGSNYKEVIEKPNGQILTPQGKNVKMTVPKGTIVHPTYDAFMNSLNMELLSNNIMPVGMGDLKPMIVNNGLSKDEIKEVMSSETSRLISTINKQHGINISIDENGISKYVTKKGVTSKIMNARFSGKGRKV